MTKDEEEDNLLKCLKCSVDNCQKCFGTINDDKCISCHSSFVPIYENNKIIECRPLEEIIKNTEEMANKEQIDINDKFINENKYDFNYSFKVEYFTDKNNTSIKLINSIYLNNIIEMILDGEKIMRPTSEYYHYHFAGKHFI